MTRARREGRWDMGRKDFEVDGGKKEGRGLEEVKEIEGGRE